MAVTEIPEQLDLVRKFVNSLDVEESKDELDTTASLAAWLSAHGLAGEDSPSEDDRRRAVGLREALRALLLANTGEPLDPGAVETLNRVAGELDLQLRFRDDGAATLRPACDGVDVALATILANVFRSMADGTWSRLKACSEDSCQWAFYDQSRNRSGTWCSMAVCGNRTKARKYRERHKSL
jgi:predicted RNA-binding Zn ribbon-like protein